MACSWGAEESGIQGSTEWADVGITMKSLSFFSTVECFDFDKSKLLTVLILKCLQISELNNEGILSQ